MPDAAPQVAVTREDPRQSVVVRLVEALDTYLYSLYPAETCHLLDIDALAAPDLRFFVARCDGAVAGCAALRVDAAGYGELKRLYVDPAVRGARIGRRLLEHVEAQARAEGLSAILLETGIRQSEALGLYHAFGYRERGPFACYTPNEVSLFMEKPLLETVP